MNIRVRTTAAALLAASLALAACQPKGDVAGGQPVLRVASQKGGTRSLMLASHALDGAPYRVEWSEFPAAQSLIEALSANAADVGAVGDAPFMFAYSAGAPIKVVMVTRSSGGGASTAIVVPDASPIHTPADLKGRRIATGKGSIGHYLLLKVLQKAGLKPSDVNVVYLAPGDAKAALSSGAVDAWATWGPYTGFAQLHDHNRIVADGQGVMHGIGFQVSSTAAIAGKRAQLEDFLHRLAVAQRWEATHKAEYAAVLAKETGLPLDVANYMIGQARGQAVPIDASVIDEERDTLETYARAGVIPKAPAIEGAFDTSFNGVAAAPAATPAKP
jgi:sulfonate transport system substrate-binding protein